VNGKVQTFVVCSCEAHEKMKEGEREREKKSEFYATKSRASYDDVVVSAVCKVYFVNCNFTYDLSSL
jgi:hypothetical protein